MKSIIKNTLITGTLTFSALLLNAQGWDSLQLDSLKRALFSKVDSTGIFYPISNTMRPGEALTLYHDIFYDDFYNYAVKISEWTDPLLGITHTKYQQFFDVVPVEGAQFIEHSKNGYVLYINGKVGEVKAEQAPESILGDMQCWDSLLINHGLADHQLAYQDPDWEQQIRKDMEDSSATLKPVVNAELVMALKDWRNLGYLIPSKKYIAAWKFEVLSLVPSYHKAFYVDAVTGELIRESDLRHSDGPASIWYHGTQTIDTRERGFPYNDHILNANSDQRNFETRYWPSSNSAWWTRSKIDDNDDNWGTSHHGATAIHWFTMQSWDYFSLVHGRNGMDGNGAEIRVQADGIYSNAYFGFLGGVRTIAFGREVTGYYGRSIDYVGHEFTHGVTNATSALEYEFESGALNESFSDIFGHMIEVYTEGSGASWILGDAEPGLRTRSLIAPKTDGVHANENCTEYLTGQPDTYEGDFWCDCEYSCDYGGVHINSGVQNRWFSLLVNGGTGTNDNNDAYTVNSIDIDNAAEIAYWTLTNQLTNGSQFEDARALSLESAIQLFGECSNEHIQVANAWFAVGVGEPSECEGLNVNAVVFNKSFEVNVYPNPTLDLVNIRMTGSDRALAEIYSVSGTLMITQNISYGKNQMDLSKSPSGIYLIQVHSESGTFNQRIIKH